MNKFSNIKTVITDLDDTLIPFAYAYSHYVKELVTGISKAADMPEEEVAKGFNELYLQKGIFQFEDVLHLHKPLSEKFPNEDLNIKFAKEIAKSQEVLKEKCQPEKETIATLMDLKNKGIELVLFTAGPASFTIDKLKCSGLEGFFDHIYAVKDNREGGQEEAKEKHPSKEWEKLTLLDRFPKSNSETYKNILNDLGRSPKETLMMGDNDYQDIYKSKKAGLRTVLVKGHKANNKPHEMINSVLAKDQKNKIRILIQKLRLSFKLRKKNIYTDAVVEYPSGLKKLLAGKTKFLDSFVKKAKLACSMR